MRRQCLSMFYRCRSREPAAGFAHFAAAEEPQLLAEDLRAWFRPFREKIAAGSA